jgi:hypothetical protein
MEISPSLIDLADARARHREGVLLVLLATVSWSAGGLFTRLLPFDLWTIDRSGFIATDAYNKIVRAVPPMAVRLMHVESVRPFPVLRFASTKIGGGWVDPRVDGVASLISVGASRARNTLPPGSDTGVSIVCEWTELGSAGFRRSRPSPPPPCRRTNFR